MVIEITQITTNVTRPWISRWQDSLFNYFKSSTFAWNNLELACFPDAQTGNFHENPLADKFDIKGFFNRPVDGSVLPQVLFTVTR